MHSCNDIRMNKAEADLVVLQSIQSQAKTFLETEELNKEIKKTSFLSVTEQIISISNSLESMKKSWLGLYDKYADGEISREQYVQQKKDYDDQIERMEAELLILKADTADTDTENGEEAVELAESILQTDVLTEEMKETLIDKVIVFLENRLEIVWAYREA